MSLENIEVNLKQIDFIVKCSTDVDEIFRSIKNSILELPNLDKYEYKSIVNKVNQIAEDKLKLIESLKLENMYYKDLAQTKSIELQEITESFKNLNNEFIIFKNKIPVKILLKLNTLLKKFKNYFS